MMKCPYQTIVIHKPEYTDGYLKQFPMDITQFGNCIGEECPYYRYKINFDASRTERCLKAESEVKNDDA